MGKRTISPDNHFGNKSIQGTWKKAFPKKGREWITDVTYSAGKMTNVSDWTTYNYDENGVLTSDKPDVQKIDGGSIGNQLTIQSLLAQE